MDVCICKIEKHIIPNDHTSNVNMVILTHILMNLFCHQVITVHRIHLLLHLYD